MKPQVRKQIQASHAGRVVNVGYVSLQDDGSISFGLNDRTFIAPRWRERAFVWNANNRITVQYAIESSSEAMLPVENPHFTYHPDAMFHLKSNKDKKANDEAIFEGIADVGIVLHQQGEMPWIRAVSGRVDHMKSPGAPRSNNVQSEDLITEIPALMSTGSLKMEIDLIRSEDVVERRDQTTWEYVWGKVGVRIKTGYAAPRIATLSWFHSS